MSLEPGQSLAHYRVAAKIGEGGMGEVYRAHDGRLRRDVAIKVLPAALAGDAERLARFQREAHVLASLSHPGIAAIYGLEEAGGVHALVLELVEGPDLARRLAAGALPLDEALDLALQIAEALEAAHEKGVVHRDLKPANVKITPEGAVKVLDFGLAKAFEDESAETSLADASRSPTLTAAATRAGVILGTAAYMAPEQARGKPADRRADIWAFGVVLYEMLTGQRLFPGETVTDVLAAVLTREPDWAALPAGTPSGVRRLLARCLQRDPKQRLQAIGDARIELQETQLAPAEAGADDSAISRATPAPGAALRLLPWAMALLAALAAGWLALRPVPTEVPAARIAAALPPPGGLSYELRSGFALSPRGDRLTFAAVDENGVRSLWIRPLQRDAPRQVASTEGARAPFWSPDGRHLGFTVGDRLKRIEVETGLQETLADTSGRYGGTWAEDGSILFGGGYGLPLMLLPPGGGEPRPVTTVEVPGDTHQWPVFLPGGRRFVFLVRGYGQGTRSGQIYLGSLDGEPPRPLTAANSNAAYAEPGWLVWWHDGNLRAHRLNPDSATLVGEPVVLASGAAFDPRIGQAPFTVSGQGALVYASGSEPMADQLSWVDRAGTLMSDLGDPGSNYVPRLSPDGRRIALDISDETNRGDIWVLDAERGSGRRLTSALEDETSPVWSPDGRQVAYYGYGQGEYARPSILSLQGREPPRVLEPAQEMPGDIEPSDWGRDGLLVLTTGGGGRFDVSQDIWIYSLEDDDFQPYLETPFKEVGPRISPQGDLLAYVSDETGQDEVYVGTFPEAGPRWRISPDGGWGPFWGPREDELFFCNDRGEILAIPLELARDASGAVTGVEIGSPELLIGAEMSIKEHTLAQVDTVDGQRFLVNREVGTLTDRPLSLVLNWATEFDEGPAE